MKYKRIKAAVLIILFLVAGAFYSTDRRQDFSLHEQETVTAQGSLVTEDDASGGDADAGEETAGNVAASDTTAGDSAASSDNTSEDSAAATGVTDESAEAVSTDRAQNTIRVHVCGAVKSSGVYELPEGSIVQDAIAMAGGVKKTGARDYLNLAEAVSDGEKIYVPYKKELDEENTAGILSNDGTTAAGQETGTSSDSSGSDNSLVNINEATKEELTTLNGIGDARAQAIIDYRTENGAFASIEDIMLVSGIKEGAFAKIKDQITV